MNFSEREAGVPRWVTTEARLDERSPNFTEFCEEKSTS